ncbi:unnamed protein product [Cercopithifilaria johnstoni]|uniref:Uncharacterized protein n=1 Tax=Cercopithifilaria johnstoni TaxID=2874296 RepID=A0A8J2PRZ0_9BILA|nr:unnamed protein product [Cercopithifilaria johnstoni]
MNVRGLLVPCNVYMMLIRTHALFILVRAYSCTCDVYPFTSDAYSCTCDVYPFTSDAYSCTCDVYPYTCGIIFGHIDANEQIKCIGKC